MLELDVLGNSNERGNNSTIELGTLGDDALEGFLEITSREGEAYDSVAERHGVEDLTKRDTSDTNKSAVSTGVELDDGDVGVGPTVPLRVRDDVTHSQS